MNVRKFCPGCKQTKSVGEFHQDRSRKDGLTSWCKSCQKAYREARPRVLSPTVETKLCPMCGETKPASEFHKCLRRKDGLNYSCKTCIRAHNKAYNKAHKEEAAAYDKAYASTEKGKQAHSQAARRRRAHKLGAGGDHTTVEFIALCEALDFRCQGCGRIFPLNELTEDHMVPLSRGGGDDINNIQPLCRSCNASKSDKTREEWVMS